MDKLRTTIILSLILVAMFALVVSACNQPIEEDIPEPTQTQEAVTYKVVEVITIHDDIDTPETESVTEVITEPSETTPSTESSTTSYYNVNLPEYIQDVVIDECKRYGIDPAIVIAMIERESRFDRYALGDDGRSFGLMQIQPKWHLRLMIEMGCTDLFDPVQNIKVGIAILGSLKLCYNDVGTALTYYNSGKIVFNDYAKSILARANEI